MYYSCKKMTMIMRFTAFGTEWYFFAVSFIYIHIYFTFIRDEWAGEAPLGPYKILIQMSEGHLPVRNWKVIIYWCIWNYLGNWKLQKLFSPLNFVQVINTVHLSEQFIQYSTVSHYFNRQPKHKASIIETFTVTDWKKNVTSWRFNIQANDFIKLHLV